MGFLINQNKLKRNKVMRRKPTNIRRNRNTACRAPCITEILSNGSWKGKTCFLIGGGPSLKDFDFNLIKDYLTIGVNKSFTEFSTTINYAMDARFYDMVTSASKPEWKKLHQQWLNYKGVKVFVRRSNKFKFDESVYVVNNLSDKAISFDLKKGIYSGNNSGFGALMLAIALGSTRIYLLGYDLKVRDDSGRIRTHFHEGYSFQNGKAFQSKLNKFKKCFEEFSSKITELGVRVVNLNLDSALECFLKEDLTIVLKKK